jgi:hypothetical protein
MDVTVIHTQNTTHSIQTFCYLSVYDIGLDSFHSMSHKLRSTLDQNNFLMINAKIERMNVNLYSTSHTLKHINSFPPLGATAQGELWPPEQSASILLYIHPRLII